MRPGRFHPGNGVDDLGKEIALSASMRPGRFHPGNGDRLHTACQNPLRLRDNFKAHLSKVVVQRQCSTDSQFSHENKAAAVGKGEFLIPIAEEE